MALAPYLNTNAGKNDEAFSLGLVKNTWVSRVDEVSEIVVFWNGSVVYRSGPLRGNSIEEFSDQYKGYYRHKDRVKVRLYYTRYIRGVPYLVSRPLPFNFVPLPNGKALVKVSGKAARSSRALASARSRVNGFAKNPFMSRLRKMSNSAPRLSPERMVTSFLRVFQTSAGLNTQDVVFPTRSFRTYTGVRTPGFGSLNKRVLPDNPYSMRLTQVTSNRYVWNQVQPASGAYDLRIRPYSEVYSMPDSPTLFIPEADSIALQRLIQAAQQGINANMLQNIAQISQLSQLIFGNAKKIAQSLIQLKRGNIPAAVSTLLAGQSHSRWPGRRGNPSRSKSLASNWLELQYGWKPLLSDISGFMTSLGILQNPNDFVQRASSSGRAQRNYTLDYPPGDATIGFSNHGTTRFAVETTTRYRIRFKVEDAWKSFFAQLGFTNPINLVWEILPFSFVVDWFLPIGNYLESMSAFDGCVFLGGTKSTLTKIRGDSTIGYNGPSPLDSTVFVNFTATQTREETRYDRSVLTNFPSPILPSFNKAGLQAGARAANAIALLVQVFK